MAKHCWDSLVAQLLVLVLMLLLCAPLVEPASRGLASRVSSPTAAPAPTPEPEPTSPAAPTPAVTPAPANPTAPSPALTPATPIAPAPASTPTTRNYTWNVEYILWAPDCRQHGMIGINGSFPGPNITTNAGDRIVVVVNNRLHTEGVVIHWHGIRQIGTPWADGTASISQCPINPGESFTYEFTADKPGTFFYHGHFGMQRAAGLYGSLIVKVPVGEKEPFRYDDELNMLLSDWYHEAVYAQAAGLERKDKHFQWIGEPQTLLINGRGQYDCSLGINRDRRTCDRRKRDALCKEGDKSESCELIRRSEFGPFCEASQCAPVVFDVQPGKTYRLRIASTTSLSALNVQVQGHKMEVVEADGNYVKMEPLLVDDIDIYSGESYSVLLTTDKEPSSYWISVGVRGREPKTPPALAILNYTNAKSDWPTGVPPATPAWDDVNRSKKFTYSIEALHPQQVPNRTTPPIVMLNTQELVDGHVKWAINHVSLALPATPYLGAYYSGLERDVFDTTSEAPRGFSSNYDVHKPPESQAPEARTPATVRNQVYRFKHGEVVDVVIQNANMRREGVSESHPWHLHGHDFWVLGYGDGAYRGDADDKAKLNLENPPLRNTVVVFPWGWTAIRFVADNPGVWAFHCHIEPHLHMGMGVIFAEGMEKLHELKEKVPKEAFVCGVVSKRATVSLPPTTSPAPAP